MISQRLARLLACLPESVQTEIVRTESGQENFEGRLSEIRIRARHNAALTLDGRNLLLPVVTAEEEIRATLERLCAGSVYAYGESLCQGYLTALGFRIGVGGRAVTSGGIITGLSDPTSLCIRVPHRVAGAGDEAVRLFRELGGRSGILVYSPPGVGKTTLLRDLSCQLSSGPSAMRVALIDVRGELYDEEAPVCCQLDILRGYPLAAGIEIATRTLSPEVILCDEIGSYADAESILSVEGAGVPIVATAHGGTVGELMTRAPIRLLSEAGVFAAYLGIARHRRGYAYTVDYEMRADARRAGKENALCTFV